MSASICSMRQVRVHVARAIILAVILTPAARGQTATGRFRAAARTFRYLDQRDDFLRQHSVVALEPTTRPGGDISYYGNRLNKFRYFSPVGEGGYYEAWNDYVRRRKLDPNNYQYRINYP